jgi:peptidoglycan/xylan/chitin deacetylase (PgdA/CDA1 family)
VTSAGQLLAEVEETRRLLLDATGIDSRLFRPPWGKLSGAKLWRLLRMRQTVVLWNVDPGDYETGSASDVAAWTAQQPFRAGDLLLLHDDRPHAADLIAVLSRAVRSRGLRFGRVDEWTT